MHSRGVSLFKALFTDCWRQLPPKPHAWYQIFFSKQVSSIKTIEINTEIEKAFKIKIHWISRKHGSSFIKNYCYCCNLILHRTPIVDYHYLCIHLAQACTSCPLFPRKIHYIQVLQYIKDGILLSYKAYLKIQSQSTFRQCWHIHHHRFLYKLQHLWNKKFK